MVRKILAGLAVALLISVPTLAADLSGMTFEELKNLQCEITKEMATRPEVNGSISPLPEHLSKSFGKGVWTLFSNTKGVFRVHISDDEISVLTTAERIAESLKDFKISVNEDSVKQTTDTAKNTYNQLMGLD